MDRFINKLKEKGPLGMPLGFWVAVAAIVLYLGYRYWRNRSGSSSSDSSASDSSSLDPSGANYGNPPSPDYWQPSPPPDPGIPTTPAPTDVSPEIVPSGITIPGLKKKKEKKRHNLPHDKKQGTRHTKSKPVPRPGKRRAHAPKTDKTPHSTTKRRHTRNIPPPSRKPLAMSSRSTSLTPPVAAKLTAASRPSAIASAPSHQAKAPVKSKHRKTR